MNFKAYLFDFDYTLAFSEPAILICYRHVFDTFGFTNISDETIKRTIGLPLKRALVQMTNINDDAELAKMESVFQTKADEVMTAYTELYPAVIPLFEELAKRGAKIGIVSNKFSFRIWDVLERYNISKYVSLVIGCDQITAHKPSPDGLLLALDRLEISKDDAIYIGDSIIDCQTAKNAGMSFAAVTTGTSAAVEFEQEPHLIIISELSQLQKICDKA